jgi:hypothetical protein
LLHIGENKKTDLDRHELFLESSEMDGLLSLADFALRRSRPRPLDYRDRFSR